MIDILYGLGTTELLPLDYFNAGSDKELVFVIGETEVTATLGEDQTLHFGDLSHLDLLSPDDFLSIRLYANNDMGNTLWEWAFMNLDVDVDSDNNNGLDLPDRSPEEEAVENVDGEPGKILVVNSGDTDNDGIPDYADFDSGRRFVPMVIQLPDDIDLATAQIKITYPESDPTMIDINSSVSPAVHTPAEGYLRIWKINGDESRSIDDINAAGHYVRSDQNIALNLFQINIEREITLYMEMVRETNLWGELKIQTEIIEP
jgi:WD40 repeat protein